MSDLTKAIITILILGISWGIGRLCRSRVSPKKRSLFGLGVVFLSVIPLVVANNLLHFASRSELRSMLILFCLGWVTGLFRKTRKENLSLSSPEVPSQKNGLNSSVPCRDIATAGQTRITDNSTDVQPQ